MYCCEASITKRLSAKQCNEMVVSNGFILSKDASARARERLQASGSKKGIEDWAEQKSPRTCSCIDRSSTIVARSASYTPSIGLLFSRYRSDHSQEHFLASKPCWALLHYLIKFAFQKTWTHLMRTADRVSAAAADQYYPCYPYPVYSFYSS